MFSNFAFIPLTVAPSIILQPGYMERIVGQARAWIVYAQRITSLSLSDLHKQATDAVKHTIVIEAPGLAVSAWLEQDAEQNLRAIEEQGYQRNARLRAFVHGPTADQRVDLYLRDRFVGALPKDVAAWVRPLICTGRLVITLSDIGQRTDMLFGGTYAAARVTIGSIAKAIQALDALQGGDGAAGKGLPALA